MTLASKRYGNLSERRAQKFLEARGFTFVRANYRTPFGELDLVMCDANCLVFVEVKARRTGQAGLPAEAVNSQKLKHLIRAAQSFFRNHPHNGPWRIDVVEINGSTVNHLSNVTASVL